jgi:hypothetical protein
VQRDGGGKVGNSARHGVSRFEEIDHLRALRFGKLAPCFSQKRKIASEEFSRCQKMKHEKRSRNLSGP